jgi:hypothetical protein
MGTSPKRKVEMIQMTRYILVSSLAADGRQTVHSAAMIKPHPQVKTALRYSPPALRTCINHKSPQQAAPGRPSRQTDPGSAKPLEY